MPSVSLLKPNGQPRRDCEILLKDSSIAKQVRKDVKAALEDFAENPHLTIYAQSELDLVLSRIDDDWPTSDRRKKMLERWKDVKDPVDRYFISERLSERDAPK